MGQFLDTDIVTAGELRADGINIQESIPDHAWIFRDALRWEGLSEEVDEKDPSAIIVSMRLTAVEPFRWVEERLLQ